MSISPAQSLVAALKSYVELIESKNLRYEPYDSAAVFYNSGFAMKLERAHRDFIIEPLTKYLDTEKLQLRENESSDLSLVFEVFTKLRAKLNGLNLFSDEIRSVAKFETSIQFQAAIKDLQFFIHVMDRFFKTAVCQLPGKISKVIKVYNIQNERLVEVRDYEEAKRRYAKIVANFSSRKEQFTDNDLLDVMSHHSSYCRFEIDDEYYIVDYFAKYKR